jgi:hypothetical protein
LEFDDAVVPVVRARIEYALRVFASIYGHPVVEPGKDEAEFRLVYGLSGREASATGQIRIPALYSRIDADVRNSKAPARFDFAGQEFPLFLGKDLDAGSPDWLGEIFLWLSGELEFSAKQRDEVGRIPFSGTPFGRHGLTPRKPYAALLMAWLENALRKSETSDLPKAPSPIVGVKHIVLPSHDIDFHFNGFRSAFVRLSKNLLIAARIYKDSSFFRDNSRKLAGLLASDRPGDYLFPLLDAVESLEFRSTIFPVVRRAHRRDPNYSLENIASPLSRAIARGFSVGLHGSYRSVMEERSLVTEAAILGERIGKRPRANRQHWLRFQSQRALFREIESAGMLADSSLGFPESVGFRNGACFAYPPYDFERETAHRFLEVPLVLMDGGLEAEARRSGQPAVEIADEVLNESRNAGWGGVSILWHNPVEPISVPGNVNEVFWRCAEKRKDAQESWLTFDQFISAVLPRYQQAGLLERCAAYA